MRISNWILESIGWVLLLLGLYTFYTCFGFLDRGQVVEGAVGGAIGFAVFRGGINLIRLSVASRAITAEAGIR
jgi:hypothetical protein